MPEPVEFDDVRPAWESRESAQWWLLYAVMVANKPAEITKAKLDKVLAQCGIGPVGGSPFYRIQVAVDHERLVEYLREARTGQYARLEKSFTEIVEFGLSVPDPRDWALSTLLGISGVGPKTSRWFRLLVNPRERVAALDTHVLKFLADNYDPRTVPKVTPVEGPTYRHWEREFVAVSDRFGLTPRELDYFVWSVYRNSGHLVL